MIHCWYPYLCHAGLLFFRGSNGVWRKRWRNVYTIWLSCGHSLGRDSAQGRLVLWQLVWLGSVLWLFLLRSWKQIRLIQNWHIYRIVQGQDAALNEPWINCMLGIRWTALMFDLYLYYIHYVPKLWWPTDTVQSVPVLCPCSGSHIQGVGSLFEALSRDPSARQRRVAMGDSTKDKGMSMEKQV